MVGLSIRRWKSGVVSQLRPQSRLVATSRSGGGRRVPATLNHHERRTGCIWDDRVTNRHTFINSARYYIR